MESDQSFEADCGSSQIGKHSFRFTVYQYNIPLYGGVKKLGSGSGEFEVVDNITCEQ